MSMQHNSPSLDHPIMDVPEEESQAWSGVIEDLFPLTPTASDREQNSASSKTSQVLQGEKSKQNVRKVTVKATHKGDTVRIEFSPTMGFTELKNGIAKRLKLKDGTFNIKYEDDDRDMILVNCDDSLKECISFFEKQGNDIVRLFIFDKITGSSR